MDVGVLDDSCRVAENEVDGACYVAVGKELAVAVDVKGVLVCKKVASVEC